MSSSRANQQTSQPSSSSTLCTTGKTASSPFSPTPLSSSSPATSRKTTVTKSNVKNKTVIDLSKQQQRRDRPPQAQNSSVIESSLLKRKPDSKKSARDLHEESSSSSQEMTISSPQINHSSVSQKNQSEHLLEQETNIDCSLDNQATDDDESTTLLESNSSSESEKKPAALTSRVSGDDLDASSQRLACPPPAGWKEHTDKEGVYFWHTSTGVIQRTRSVKDELKQSNNDEQTVLYHDDEEINQTSIIRQAQTSSDEDDYTLEMSAALTLADDITMSDAISFVVYPIGCCEFDETELISANNTKAIQKCILRLSNRPNKEETMCWGLGQSQPILMRLMDDHIQFTDLSTQSLLRSQPIQTIKTWAVDDDNNFAFVVEDLPDVGATNEGESQLELVDYALLTGPILMCYVFSSMDDDDMSMKVAAKLNKEINRYREQMSNRISKSTRSQHMIESKPLRTVTATNSRSLALDNDQTDADKDLEGQNRADGDDDDDLAESSEVTLKVRYIGNVQVPRPMGIDVLNVAIDQCLADASRAQMNRLLNQNAEFNNAPNVMANFNGHLEIVSPLVEAKIHVSPSSVIVENEQTGEIIVECRIRYLTFMGISRRDIRWCGFIMQNTTNQTFVAHCFECHPTAGHVCEAIQMSCSRMYEKMVKRQRMKQQLDDATSIMPKSSKIRDTLAKTLSKIKLTPII